MDALYHDPVLVDAYDALNASRADFDFYTAEFPRPPARLLDIGCGTGTFALELADRGYAVTAIDPAAPMIARARQKDTRAGVTWISGHVADVPAQAVFDAACMTGHAIQCLLQPSELAELFRAVQVRLRPGGAFWFETRNPAMRPWLRWSPAHAGPAVSLGHGRTVRVVHQVLDVKGPLVTFEERYQFSDRAEEARSCSTLRFWQLEEIADTAQQNGLRVEATYGTWQRGPLHANSPEIILRLQRPDF